MSTGTLKNNLMEQDKGSIISRLSKIFMLKEKTGLQNIKKMNIMSLLKV
ncbi:hypothetical protein Bccel_5036 [Pseudobacteroides cellulosolvens ATCC 35603 = DSM 2933]|uniref:Uncharacterized protein n=1 Tax=Pseudobacteroides cellulosolvens ATCC 35603 = DSM 2933 TaxID=398512 RepID=A0A0L6JVM3_9FIRM|nr:hypothetical protein Bccel_5036 [Pseudobacteroides cellulosolvens ATCC 35603 = DSM 2933]